MSDVLHHIQATHTRQVPVFVVGYPRSGTSLTCRLMRRYLKVSFGTESQFILRYQRRLPHYGDLALDANVRRLLGDIATERFFARSRRNWGFVFDQEAAFQALRGRRYADVLDAVFGQLALHNGMGRWGDKTPQYNDDLEAIRDLFPDAQFVHIVRDGRDVALSVQQTNFGPKNALECALAWRRALAAISAFGRRLPASQFHELRYEDLIEAPTRTLDELGRFLGIADDDGSLARAIEAQVANDVRGNNAGKWRRAMHPREVERFEGLAGPYLSRWGYGLDLRGLARRPTTTERLFWRAHGTMRRLTFGGYWADTVYKVRLRADAAARGLLRSDAR